MKDNVNKALLNNVLLIVKKTGEKSTYTVPFGKDHKDSYHRIIKSEGLDKSEIEKFYFFTRTQYTPEHYARYWDINEDRLDEEAMAVEHKLEEVRNERAMLFNKLDIAFMRSMEETGEDAEEMKEHVVSIKNYLRTLPELLIRHLAKSLKEKTITLPEIVTFNIYNNIFRIGIVNEGSGYTSPPTVQIEEPNGRMRGFPLKAVVTIKDDKVNKVNIIQIGSGYAAAPKITISPPDDPDGIQAEAFASSPENDIFDNVSHLEKRI